MKLLGIIKIIVRYFGFDHINLYVKDIKKSKEFYDPLLIFLGFKKIHDEETFAGWSNGSNGLWIEQTGKKYRKDFHRKNSGINHLAFRADSKEAVNSFYNDFLLKNNIPVLYGGPKDYPEYRKGYYAVFFEDPDRLKLEIMYFPK